LKAEKACPLTSRGSRIEKVALYSKIDEKAGKRDGREDGRDANNNNPHRGDNNEGVSDGDWDPEFGNANEVVNFA